VPLIVLIGPPGAGKSSVARALGKLIDLPNRDTDQLIEAKSGKKISDIFIEDGEAHFRNIEKEVVLAELKQEAGVLSLGGGSVMNEEVALELAKSRALVVFLDVGIANAASRVGFNRDRPLLTINPRQQWLSLMEKRRPVYESLATHTLSTDDQKPQEVALKIAEILGVRK
jgi:shikimate kinase